jgi:hypothetical protein
MVLIMARVGDFCLSLELGGGAMRYTRRLIQLSLILILSTGVSCTTGESGTTEPSLGSSSEIPTALPVVGIPDPPFISVDVLSCSPQDYAITSKVIGSKGGRIMVGSHQLEIPAGALSQPVTIVAEQITGSTNSVRFGPEGLAFARPAELTMSYANCLSVPAGKQIVYTDEQLKVLELLRSSDRARTKTVTSAIDHFSRYAVAY